MFRKLGEFLKSYTLDGVLIVGGDWNCTLNFLLHRNNEEPHSVSASFLKSIILQNDLVDVWRDRNKEMKQYTWTKVSQGMISVARLDRFYVKHAENNRIMGCNIFPCCLSDHHFITVNIILTQSKFNSPYWKFNVALLKENDFHEKFKLFWNEWGSKKNDTVVGNRKDTSKLILSAVYMFFNNKKIKQNFWDRTWDLSYYIWYDSAF